jgi:hypothetical protein
MLNVLPNSALLNRIGFNPLPVAANDEGSRKHGLILSIPHQVRATISTPRVFEKDINYILETRESWTAPIGLKVTKSVAYIGEQEMTAAKDLINQVRHRAAEKYSTASTQFFDWRAFCYVLGFYSARCSTGLAYDIPTTGIPVTLLDTERAVINNSVYIHNGMFSDNNEFVTLLRLLRQAGCETAILVDDSAMTSGRVLLRRGLGAYCLKLLSQIIFTASSLGCSSHHLAAFFRGQNCAWTLRGHNDEGGWIRKLFKVADYPPTIGILSPSVSTETFNGIPLRKRVDERDVLIYNLSIFFSCVRCVSAADPGSQIAPLKLPLILESCDKESQVPSCFPTLRNHVLDWWQEFMLKISEVWSFTPNAKLDYSSMIRYFVDNEADRHLKTPYITPFFWVEPAGLNHFSNLKDPYFVPGSSFSSISSPLLPAQDLIRGHNYRETDGFVATNSILYATVSHTSFRHWGLSYLFNSAYNSDNGLSMIRVTSQAERGYIHSPLFCTNGDLGLHEARWVTPDNPVPNPMEGVIGNEPVLLKIMGRTIKNWPLKEQWSTVQTYFSLGAMRLVHPKDYHPRATTTVRRVPRYLERAVRQYDAYCAERETLADKWLDDLPTINVSTSGLGMSLWDEIESLLKEVRIEESAEPDPSLSTDGEEVVFVESSGSKVVQTSKKVVTDTRPTTGFEKIEAEPSVGEGLDILDMTIQKVPAEEGQPELLAAVPAIARTDSDEETKAEVSSEHSTPDQGNVIDLPPINYMLTHKGASYSVQIPGALMNATADEKEEAAKLAFKKKLEDRKKSKSSKRDKQ